MFVQPSIQASTDIGHLLTLRAVSETITRRWRLDPNDSVPRVGQVMTESPVKSLACKLRDLYFAALHISCFLMSTPSAQSFRSPAGGKRRPVRRGRFPGPCTWRGRRRIPHAGCIGHGRLLCKPNLLLTARAPWRKTDGHCRHFA